MPNLIAIVGRPNVGKSTFFNRLLQKREAIVDSVAGVTRDRHYGRSDWNGVEFSVIDTGGYIVGSEDIFESEIRRQVELAVDEASVILFLVDALEGVHEMDREIAQMLRKTDKKVLLVVNKVDIHARQADAAEFYALGLGDFFTISAQNGSGTGELLDALIPMLPETEDPDLEEGLPRFAVIGRPNVGKSSFINALTGQDRFIVSEVAGTTRDSAHLRYQQFGHDFILVDTAGLRKKTKVHENLEFYSTMRSIRAIESSDVCFLLIDATRGMEAQDVSIFSLAEKNRKGVVVLVNKWDLFEKNTQSADVFKTKVLEALQPSMDVPVLFVSALTKQRLLKALEEGMAVYQRRKTRISTSKLNELMLPIIDAYPPPSIKGKYVKIKYITQLPTHYPQFVFFANLPQYVKEPYRRFLERQLRDNFDLTGAPVDIFIRPK